MKIHRIQLSRLSIVLMFALVALLPMIVLQSCSTESSSPYNSNHAPIIYSVQVSSDSTRYVAVDSVEVGDTLFIACNAGDDEGDVIHYNWMANHGWFADPSVWKAKWFAPETAAVCAIVVQINDEWHYASDTVTLNVMEPGFRNHKPTIDSLFVVPDSVEVQDTVSFRCVVSDLEHDTVSISWSTIGNVGMFFDAFGPEIQWRAPNATGSVQVLLTVSDTWHTVVDTIPLTISPRGTHNRPPQIEWLSMWPEQVTVDDTAYFQCAAYDPNGDPLTFSWTATDGRVVGGGAQIAWIAPAYTSQCTVGVQVFDGTNTSSMSLPVTVLPDTLLLYQTDFSVDDVTGRWGYLGLLAGLGEFTGPNAIYWDETQQAMAITAESNYGTFGFNMQDNLFSDGSFEITMSASSTGFGRVAFIPKFANERNYVLIGLDFFTGRWDIIQAVNGNTAYMAGAWQTMSPNRAYHIQFSKSGLNCVVKMDGREIWQGVVNTVFNGPCPIGVGVYGTQGSGPCYFDNLRITDR